MIAFYLLTNKLIYLEELKHVNKKLRVQPTYDT